MRATEAALAALQNENEKLRAELGRLGPRRRPSAAPWVIGGVGLVFVAALGAIFLVAAPAPTRAPSVVTVADEPRAAEPPSEPPSAPRPRSAREATVSWSARVVKAEGLPFAPDSPCTVRATLRSDGVDAAHPEVEIACAGKRLYDSRHPLEGMASLSHGLEELPGEAAGAYRFALRYQDQGSRTGERTEASISTFDHTAVAWKTTAPAYRVELALDELSSPWTGPALFAADEEAKVPFRRVAGRVGRVTDVEGNGLVRVGETCAVEVRPAFGDATKCRVWVRCGGATLYGAEGGGYAACTVEGDRPFGARDDAPSSQDRDPALELAFGPGTARVHDDSPNPWTVSLTLSEP